MNQSRRELSTERQAGMAGPPPGAALPGRAGVVAVVAEVMSRHALRWAWQGPAHAPESWAAATGPKDLDLWWDGECGQQDGTEPEPAATTPAYLTKPTGALDRYAGTPVDAICEVLAGARVAEAGDPRRLRHAIIAVETASGPAVVDLTHGDLRVGPVLLVGADEIDVDLGTHRLTGPAAVADLLVRPVLRGRLPEPPRLAEARLAWAGTDPGRRQGLHRQLAGQLGARVADELVATAAGAQPDPDLPRRARLRLLARSLAPAAAAATWAQRRSVWPAGRHAGPLGLRIRGVVVAVVGTDGSGKSTVASELGARLHRYGLRTAGAYFGMARGNLPGVALARRLLGVPSVPAGAGWTTGRAGAGQTTGPAGAGPAAAPAAGPAGAHPRLRQVAAWFYAAEYVWRYLCAVAPYTARRRVVIVDRWVYDLRESPWPGSPAARVAEWLVPDPDVLVLPDAPAELIHRRKPERPLAEQAAQQQRYRRLLAEHPARHAEVLVDTSGEQADPLAGLVAAVVEAAHGARRRRDTGLRPGRGLRPLDP